MRLEDELTNLQNEIPEVNKSLSSRIYAKSSNQNHKSNNNLIIKRLAVIFGALLILITSVITTIIIVGNDNSIDNSVKLLNSPNNQEEYELNILKESGYMNLQSSVKGFSDSFSSLFVKEYNDGSNISVSPISVYSALAILAECTSGDTRAEILDALGITYEDLNQYYNAYSYFRLNDDGYDYFNRLSYKIDNTNSIWINNGFNTNVDCINNLANNYECYSYHTDFNKNANKFISKFVKEKTNGLIDGNFNFNKNTMIAILNTLYVKDIWGVEELSYTDNKYSFKNRDNTISNKKLLESYYSYGKYKEMDKYSFFYTNSDHLRVSFIKPNNGYNIEDIYTDDMLSLVKEYKDYTITDEIKMERYHTRCLFPAFEASCDTEINNILNMMNINSVFTNADFSNLTNENIFCDDVIHKTKLVVNEKGIEGAAATIVLGATAPAPIYKEVYFDFVLDEAFAYIISDSKGNIFFTGIVNNV